MYEKSQMHREAVERLACKASSTDIKVIMNAQSSIKQEFHRNMLFKLLQAIILGKQGRPLRRHNESAEAFQGNLYQLLLLQAEECPNMISWLQQRDYISPTIIDKIVKSMGQIILRGILNDIKSIQWLSIIADEATDISGTEQLSVSIWWVTKNYKVYEDILGAKELPNTNAATIQHEVNDILVRCTLPITQ